MDPERQSVDKVQPTATDEQPVSTGQPRSERSVNRRRPTTPRGGNAPRGRGRERNRSMTSPKEELAPEFLEGVRDLGAANFIRRDLQASGVDVEDPVIKKDLQAFELLQTVQEKRKTQPLDRESIKSVAKMLQEQMPREQLLKMLEVAFPDDREALQSLISDKELGQQQVGAGEMVAPVKELDQEVAKVLNEAHDLITQNSNPDTSPEKTFKEGNRVMTGIFSLVNDLNTLYNWQIGSTIHTKNIPYVRRTPFIKDLDIDVKPIKVVGSAVKWGAITALIAGLLLLGVLAQLKKIRR